MTGSRAMSTGGHVTDKALTVSILCGNPRPRSRTLAVATSLVEGLLRGRPYDLQSVDLADHATSMFDAASPRIEELLASVANSGLLVVASPTYKATYTGLLKAFLDRYPQDGLRGTVSVALMTGGEPAHALAVDLHLGPLLLELGAVLPSRGLFFPMQHFDRLDSWLSAIGVGEGAQPTRMRDLILRNLETELAQP